MPSTSWINAALAGCLPSLWMSLGLGLPWALALLSTRQWRSRALVAALALIMGPAWMSAWMLALGVLGAEWRMRLLQPELILAGSLLIALCGAMIAWRKRAAYTPGAPAPPLALDEKLILILIIAAVILRWIHTAFWTFTWYDSLWVYGYQARLYFLEGVIPRAIDYYPQFLQLQFAYAQIVTGAINDHAARMIMPPLQIGGILAVYLLGAQLINRRVGIIAAGLWSLHPFVGRWSIIGDLELPLAFIVTLAATFFLRAWLAAEQAEDRRRDAILAGIMLGVALFTKPTAGGLVWGILLLMAIEWLRTGFAPSRWMPRFRVVCWAGLASLPLGGVWYIRNLLLGHDAVTFPHGFWLTQARRSGDYLSWLALALAVAVVAIAIKRRLNFRRASLASLGLALMIGALLASNPILFPGRFDPPGSIIRAEEALAILAGLALIGWGLRLHHLPRSGARASPKLAAVSWALLLALPYFLTFFFSYSYHYRLGFAVVPLLILPTAWGLCLILPLDAIARWGRIRRGAYHAALILLCMPGVLAVAVDLDWSRVWLLDERLAGATQKYQVANPSLMEVVFGLRDYQRETASEPRVLAPGEERLPFFFPQMQIWDRTVQTLDDYADLGATHIIYGAKARQAYLRAGLDPRRTQLLAALGREDLFQLQASHYDGAYSYELYFGPDMSPRFREPTGEFVSNIHDQRVLFGEDLRLRAEDAYPKQIHRDTPITLQTIWQAQNVSEHDIIFALQLFNLDSGRIEQEWPFQLAGARHGHYAAPLWQQGELIRDTQVFRFPADSRIPWGGNYVMRLGARDSDSGENLPLSVDGRAAGQWWRMAGVYRIGG